VQIKKGTVVYEIDSECIFLPSNVVAVKECKEKEQQRGRQATKRTIIKFHSPVEFKVFLH